MKVFALLYSSKYDVEFEIYAACYDDLIKLIYEFGNRSVEVMRIGEICRE